MGALKLARDDRALVTLHEVCLFSKPLDAGTLGQWREFGKNMGQSQRQMAGLARTAQGYISRLEAGWLTPKRSKWADLMSAYGIRSVDVWLKMLNATRATRVLRTPATESEPLFAGTSEQGP